MFSFVKFEQDKNRGYVVEKIKVIEYTIKDSDGIRIFNKVVQNSQK